MGDSYITLEEEDFDYTYKPTLTETDIAFNDLFKKEKQ